MDRNDIDWARVAVPQPDGYDTEVALALATEAGYRRRDPGSCRTILDGAVAIRPLEEDTEVEGWCVQGDLDSANLERAATLVQSWPEGFRQLLGLVDTIYPIRSVQISPRAFPDASGAPGSLLVGSASHSEWQRFGSLYATTHDPVGTAQAFVHELAHQKLRALGVHVEHASRLIRNPPDDLFESPVRKDKPRPMTAIVHAAYSWLYICELDCRLVESARDAGDYGDVAARLFQRYLSRNVSRLATGLETVHTHVETDDAGEVFFAALMSRGARLIGDACRLLEDSAYAG